MNRLLIYLTCFIAGVGIVLTPSYGHDPRDDHEEVPLNDKYNFLLIIADDLGVDCVEAYDEHPEPGHTPVIDSLAAQGLLFRNAWSYPTCSPARSALLTGRHAYPARDFGQLRNRWRLVPSAPSDVVPGIPKALDSLVMSMLHLDPTVRPANCADIFHQAVDTYDRCDFKGVG